MVKNVKFKKTISIVIAFAMVLTMPIVFNPISASAGDKLLTNVDDNTIAFTISGDGVEKQNVQLTVGDLKKLPQETYTFSGYNHWPSLQVFEDVTGPTLKSVLECAGLKDNATFVKFADSNGTYYAYTIKELLKDERYYYPDGKTGDLNENTWPPERTEEGKKPVETLIGLSCESEYIFGKLCYGQRSPLEPTCCKSEQMEGLLPNGRILVTTEEPEKWDAPDAYPGSGTVVPGTKVKLQHGDGTPYGALVYYTLDGSEPTVKSNIANISYPEFQPKLNAPVPITGNMTIKTRTIGIGKYDSDVATYEYKLGKLACTIEGADLEKPADFAVENLKEMIPQEANYQTSEDGKIVSLKGKGVLLGTLLDKLSASNRWKVKFISTTGEEYDGGTVQEVKDQNCMLAYEVNGNEVEDVSGEDTTYIQVLRNFDNNTFVDNRLKNIQNIKLINVDDVITIDNVKLLDITNGGISSVDAGGGYRIEVNLQNNLDTKKDALLIIQVRNGKGATEIEGGKIIGYAAIKSAVDVNGGKTSAEFTMPSSADGTSYVDVFVWDNYTDCNSLGKDSHELSFNVN